MYVVKMLGGKHLQNDVTQNLEKKNLQKRKHMKARDS